MVQHIKYLITGLVLCFTHFSFGQQSAKTDLSAVANAKVDSLKKVLLSAKEDTGKVNTLNTLSWELRNTGDYAGGLTYANNAFKLAAKITPITIGVKKAMAMAKSTIGVIYFHQGNYPEALKEYFFALKIFTEIGDKNGIAMSHNNIGIIYKEQGNYPEALKEYSSSLKIRDEMGDKQGIAASHNNIGNIYYEQGKVHTNPSQKEESFNEALKEYFSSLKIREEIGDKKGIATSHNNIGNIYYEQGKTPEALQEHFSSLKIKEENGDKYGIAASHINIGEVYIKQNKVGEGKKVYETALRISREIGNKDAIKDCYSGLSEADSALGNYRGALEHYKLYIIYRDSLINEENTKKIVQSQMQFEFDKQQVADSIKNAETLKQEELKHNQEIQQQKTYTYGGVIGFLLMIIVAGVSFQAYRHKQKANEIISEQKKLVEEKQKEILDSIHYAKRIQQSLMPTEKYIERKLKG